MFRIVKGDLIKMANKGHFDAIAHGCNCFCQMGAGIALTIKKHFPLAYMADHETAQGSRAKLGTFTKAYEYPTVYNLYTQYSYSRSGVNFEPWTLKLALQKVTHDMGNVGHLGVPLIGGGLAKGNPEEIKAIIKEAAEKHPNFHITLVLL